MSWGDKKMGDFFKYFPVFPKFSITGTKKTHCYQVTMKNSLLQKAHREKKKINGSLFRSRNAVNGVSKTKDGAGLAKCFYK